MESSARSGSSAEQRVDPLPDSVTVWVLDDLDGASNDALMQATLAPEDRAELAILADPALRRRRLAARAALRIAVGAKTGVVPSLVNVVRTITGKPICRVPSVCAISVSYAGPSLAIAVGPVAAVGIDIEELDDRSFTPRLLERVMSEREHRRLRTLPADQQTHEFLRVWTAKEAYVKALGTGLDARLGEIEVSEATHSSIGQDGRPTLMATALALGPALVGTLAVDGATRGHTLRRAADLQAMHAAVESNRA